MKHWLAKYYPVGREFDFEDEGTLKVVGYFIDQDLMNSDRTEEGVRAVNGDGVEIQISTRYLPLEQ